jgi:N-acetylglutamate synthase
MITRLEELAMNAWPALQTSFYDGWVLRFAEGHTKRANSVHLLTGSRIPLEEKIGYCETLYRGRFLPVVFKLTGEGEGPAVDALLEARGYDLVDPSLVMTLDSLYAVLPGDAAGCELSVASRLDDDWIAQNVALGGDDPCDPKTAVIRRMLSHPTFDAVAVSLSVRGVPVASGYGALDGDRVGLFDIVVKKSERGKGYGEALVRNILLAARDRGASEAYLQVMADNVAARFLYSKLGFAEFYRYWYRRKL